VDQYNNNHTCKDGKVTCISAHTHVGDVFQGGIGDCWLMASMSACAEHEGELIAVRTIMSHEELVCSVSTKRLLLSTHSLTDAPTGIIANCFDTQEMNEEGKYSVRLFDLPTQVFARPKLYIAHSPAHALSLHARACRTGYTMRSTTVSSSTVTRQ
jgi:hypothetical protein